jgi:hypothetical protein
MSRRGKRLPFGTGERVGVRVIGEVVAREDALDLRRPVDDRDMRFDVAAKEPKKKMPTAIKLVRRETPGLQSMLFLRALQHGARGDYFLRREGRGRFHADDNRVLRVDKVVGVVAEARVLILLAPCRLRVSHR